MTHHLRRPFTAGITALGIASFGILCGSVAGAQTTTVNTAKLVSYNIKQQVQSLNTAMQMNDPHGSTFSTDPSRAGAVTLRDSQTFSLNGAPSSGVMSTFSTTVTSAFGKLGVAAKGHALATPPGSQSLTQINATASFFDTIKVLSNDPSKNDGKHHVIQHGTIQLEGATTVSSTVLDQIRSPLPPIDDFIQGGSSASVFVRGTGISLHNNLAGAMSTTPGPAFNQPLITSIPWTVDIVLGSVTEMNLSLSIVATAAVSNRSFITKIPASADVEADYSHTLKWGAGTYFTDEAGNVLTDLTMTSGSGFDYLHPTFGADSVPEPASWALMLGGFGGIGSVMRLARRKTVAALK